MQITGDAMTYNRQTYDLMVIGSGFAGMAAALFAANRGLSVALTGSTGGIDFSTGLIDLMAVHPTQEGRCRDDPWGAREAVIKADANHPYGLVSREDTGQAIDEFCTFLAEQSLPYTGYADKNARILTPLGTTKPTFKIPLSAWGCVQAMEQKAPTLIVDFDGLKGFSGRQIIENQKQTWPGLTTATVDFPGCGGELYPEHLAWSLADPARREELARSVTPHAQNVDCIGFPAILGLKNPMLVIEHLQELTGKKIFEIPTLPPSIAGTRLRSAFDRGLPPKGVRTFSQKMVLGVDMDRDAKGKNRFTFRLGKARPEVTVHTRYALLGSGRFLGKGLRADRTRIRETVFGLPVLQPGARTAWHRQTFFDPRGHPVNQCGLETDDCLRPLATDGIPLNPNLYAAGAILAHHDWMRMKCGAGLALATAFGAVGHICNHQTPQG